MSSPDIVLASAIPILPVKDVTAAVAYFRDVLGFAVDFLWQDPPEYAGIERDEAELHLRVDERVVIVMDGIDAYYDEIRRHDARVEVAIADRDYGMRDFAVRTPDGHVITFGQGLDRLGR